MADTLFEENYVTEDELFALPSDAHVEVINGAIVEMSPVGGTHRFICGNIHDLLKASAKQHDSGYVFMDGLIFYLGRTGARLTNARVPDVSYVSKSSIPHSWDIEKPFPGAPTLAVEVLSPKDNEEELLAKTREYLAAGTEQVWLVYPRQKEVHQYVRGKTIIQTYCRDTAVQADDLFPGLSLPLADIFALPDLRQ